MANNDPIVILAGLQQDGTIYQLHPISIERLRAEFPGVQRAPSVFVGYDTQADFESLHGPMWPQITQLLTGVSVEKLRKLGSVLVRVPSTGREIEVRE